MPPCTSRDERDDVPPPKSPLSTRAVRYPRSAASRAIPAPVMPPPMIRTSTGCSLMDRSAAARVRWENSVSVGIGCLGRSAGPVVGFVDPGGECNVDCQRKAGRHRRRLSDAVLQIGNRAQGGARRGSGARRPRASRVEANKAKTLGARLRAFSHIRARDLVPVSPAIAEPSTGETMGQSAEKMAKENHIAREAQDRWALRSHQLSAQATDDGRLAAEIVPWFPVQPDEPVITQDNGVRRDTSLEPMAKLKPVFDRRYGT